jgi:hypothetical protein
MPKVRHLKMAAKKLKRKNLAKNFNYFNVRIGLGVFCLVAIVGFLTVAGRTLAQTWVEPTQSPPLGNVAAPIWNQNASSQTGTFWINGTGQLDTALAVGSSPTSPSCTGTKLCGVVADTGAGVLGQSNGSGKGVIGIGAMGVWAQGVYIASAGSPIGVFGTANAAAGYSAAGVWGQSSGANGVGVEGTNYTGGYGVWGSTGNGGLAIYGTSNGSGYAGYFSGAVNVTGALTQNGVAVCLSNGTNCGSGGGGGGSITSISGSSPIVVSPTTGAVVISCPTCANGAGTLNYLTKYTSNGSTLGNSMIYDNGTGVAIGGTTVTGRLTITGDSSTNTVVRISSGSAVVGLSVSSTINGYVNGFNPAAISTWADGDGVYGYSANPALGSALVGEVGGSLGTSQITGAGVFGFGYSNGFTGYGVYGYGQTTSGSPSYGVYARATSSSTGAAYGMYSNVTATYYNSPVYGVYSVVSGGSSTTQWGFYTPNNAYIGNILQVGGTIYAPWGNIISIPGYAHISVLSNSWDGYGGDYVQLNAAGNGNDVGYVRMYGPSGWTVFSGNIDVRGGFELDSTGTRDSTAVRVFDNGGNLYLQYGSGGYTIFRNNVGGWVGYVIGDGFHNGSDERLKKDIVDLGDMNGLAAIDQLRPVTYYWRDEANGTGQELGFIAQEVQKLFPQVVSNGPDGMLGLNYSALVVPMVKSIQEQQKEIEDLQKQIDDLKARLNK